MSKKVLFVLSLLVVAAMVLAACAPAATPTAAPATEAPAATEAPVVTEAPAAEAPATEAPVATEAPTEVATEEVSAGAVTIKIWHAWKTNEQNSLKEVLAAFKAANPDIGFSVLYVPFDDLRSKFETATATGGGPDVLIGAADWGPAFYDAALVADLTGLVSEETLAPINPAALAAVQYKDALVGLPETIKGVVSFRNTTIMADAPTSLQDLLDKATAATQGDVVGADIEYGPFFSMANLTGCNGTLMDAAGQPTFNNEAGVCWLNIYLAGQAAGIPGEYYTDNDVNLFKAGKVGYIIDGTWNTSALAEAIGAENLAIDPWPTTDLNHMSGYVQTENIYLNANSEVNSPEAAAAATKFIEFFLSPEAQKLLADPTKAAHLPAITGVEVTDPLMSQMVTAFEGGTAFPVIPQMNAYWDPMGKALQTVLNEGVDPATALQTAYDEVMAKLAEMGG
jgi:arabinogalactan oligomer / maltooligosaccharide transport system substrate-binding protein